jgi:hypothetical protein
MKQHKGVFCRRLWWILVVTLVLLGCQRTPAPATPVETPRPTIVAETHTPVPTWTPTATTAPPTPRPTLPPSATPGPTATPTPMPVCAPVWRHSFPETEPLHDLILFMSEVSAPFARASLRQTMTAPELWAVAADGRNSERLSARANALYVRPETADGVIADSVIVDLLVTQPIPVETDAIRQHILRPECAESPCDKYQFSPGGAWAAYCWGEQHCGRGIAALNLLTDATLVLTETGGHAFTFLSDEMMLIGSGDCESSTLATVNLTTGEQRTLGDSGAIHWNVSRTAFAVNAHPYQGLGSSVWGYNLALEQHFLLPAEDHTQELQPLWTPTDDHVLYQQRVISYTTATSDALTLEPQHILIVDAVTGERRTLLADPAYDYHLCFAYEVCAWEGDFIEVRRIPFHPNVFAWEPDFSDATVDCALYGFRCPNPAERFALNWRTGELVPWDERPAATDSPTAVPTATPTPALPPSVSAPDPARPAFYTASDGTYSLHLGRDGHSLWCVPADDGEEPVLWINNGANFTYIP